MSRTRWLEVACAVLLRQGCLLLAQRADNGLWELPGGKLEPGEDPAGCLAREISEELATTVEVLQPLAVREEPRPGTGLRLHALLCRLSGPEPRALEHSQLRWVPLGQVEQYCLAPADRGLLSGPLAGLLSGQDPART